jgi:uncharacterized circularly permuted ATP-grasp superfamily protein
VPDQPDGSSQPRLIDWGTALEAAARLAAAGPRLARAIERAQAAAPVFRNRDYPLSPLPLFLRDSAVTRVGHQLEDYVRLLEKAAALYLADKGVRAWYGLPPSATELIEAEAAGQGRDRATRIGVCRLDGYLERDGERLRVLENNADAPAGTLFTPRVHTVVRSVLDAAAVPVPPHAAGTVPYEAALLDAVGPGLAEARRQGRAPSLAVLQPRGAENRESLEMTAAFRALGVDAFVADPREVTVRAGRARVGGRAIDACWNKVNTVAWQRLAHSDPNLTSRWRRVLRESDLFHLNPFLVRCVAESKLTLAMVQEPRFAPLFTAAERALAAGLLPWSRRVEPGGGLPERLLEHQHDYVLKEPYDIRGDGVTIGGAVSRSQWAEAVGRAVKDAGVVQRYVAPAAYPVLSAGAHGDERIQVVAMPVSLDTYVLRGQVAFLGSKASLKPRVNVFQGGQKLSVHVVAKRPGGPDITGGPR